MIKKIYKYKDEWNEKLHIHIKIKKKNIYYLMQYVVLIKLQKIINKIYKCKTNQMKKIHIHNKI